MKTIPMLTISLCFALLLVLGTGCQKKDNNNTSSDPKVAILGKWHFDRSVMVSTPISGITGGRSGTETYTPKYDNLITFNANGTWSQSGKDDDGTTNADTGTFSISGNTLTVDGLTAEILTLTSSALIIKSQYKDDANRDGANDTNIVATTYYSR